MPIFDTARHAPRPPGLLRLGVVAAVALAEAGHLAWEAAHGGIVSHHVLNDPTLPALWNGWGLLVLPLLAWIAEPRLFATTGGSRRMDRGAIGRLSAAALVGLALSLAFATGSEDAAGGIFVGLLLSSAVVRAYRAEYLLGFVLGMAFTFGALLPTLIGGAIALASAAVWFGPWRFIGRAVQRARA